jgi:hypothetical protein
VRCRSLDRGCGWLPPQAALARRCWISGKGLALLPMSRETFDYLGGRESRPFGDISGSCPQDIEELARRASGGGAIAYLEADMHGGAGTQAVVVWRDGEVCLGQVTTTFGWPPPHQSSRPCWAFNRALRGGRRECDEFDAVALGTHRSTEDWLPPAPEGDRNRPSAGKRQPATDDRKLRNYRSQHRPPSHLLSAAMSAADGIPLAAEHGLP